MEYHFTFDHAVDATQLHNELRDAFSDFLGCAITRKPGEFTLATLFVARDLQLEEIAQMQKVINDHVPAPPDDAPADPLSELEARIKTDPALRAALLALLNSTGGGA